MFWEHTHPLRGSLGRLVGPSRGRSVDRYMKVKNRSRSLLINQETVGGQGGGSLFVLPPSSLGREGVTLVIPQRIPGREKIRILTNLKILFFHGF